MFDLIIESPLAPCLIWAMVYISDYYSTIACARLYRAQDKIAYEGSFEITPIFQADVNALRRVSPRFLAILVASTVYLYWMRSLISPDDESFGFYVLCLGALFLIELTVHARHLRNWFYFSRVVPLLHGRLEYPRGMLLRASSLEMLTFAVLYAILYGVTQHPFVLGGVFAHTVLAINHYRLATRHEAARQRVVAGG
jgi:hypothetical protein